MTDPGALAAARSGAVPILAGGAWAGALGVMLIAYLGGWLLLPRRRAWGRVETLLARLLAGLVPASLAMLLVGQGPLCLSRALWLTLAGLGLIVLIAQLVTGFWGRQAAAPRQLAPEPTQEGNAGLLALAGWVTLLFVFLFLLIPAFTPPINYDVLEYHLGIVPHVFELGQVRPIPHVFYTAQPLATEMLYTLAAIIEGTPWGQAPEAAHWLMLGLGLGIVAEILRWIRVPRAWRPWLLLILLMHPIIFTPNLGTMSDWTGLLMLAGGIWIWLTRDRVPATPYRTAALMGIFVGGGLSAKWTHFGTVVVPLLVLAFCLGMPQDPAQPALGVRQRGRRAWACAGLCGAVGFLCWLPWGAWLWAAGGNPLSPFLAGFFPTPQWPPARLHFLLATHGPLALWQLDYWTNLAARLGWRLPGLPLIALALVAPVAVAALGWAEAAKPSHANGLDRDLPRPADPARALLFALAPGLLLSALLWGQLRQSADRFLTPTLLAAVLMLAACLQYFTEWFSRARGRRDPRGARLTVAGLLAAAALWGVYQPLAELGESGFTKLMLQYDLGRIGRTAYWHETLGATAELFDAANALPPGARIIAVNDARRYPFVRPIALASVFDESPLRPAVTGASDGEMVRRRLVAAGFTHLLVNEFEQERILHMHTPPRLVGDPSFQALLAGGDRSALIERTIGATEFSVDPLTAREETVYRDFLNLMRRRAVWSNAPAGTQHPAMWIAVIGK